MPWRTAPACPVTPPPSALTRDVEARRALRCFERLAHDLQQLRAREVFVDGFAVDGDDALTERELNARDGALTAPGRLNDLDRFVQKSSYASSESGCGFCASCGCASPAYTFRRRSCASRMRFVASIPRTAFSIKRSGCLSAISRAVSHLESAGIVAVPVVELLLPLITAELDLLRIDDDHVVAVVDVRRPGRLVLAREGAGDPHRKRAETFAGRIDDIPSMLRLGRFLLVGAHNQGILRESPRSVKRAAAAGPRQRPGARRRSRSRRGSPPRQGKGPAAGR